MSTTTTARSVPAGRAVALVYRVVLRQLISRGRLIALTLSMNPQQINFVPTDVRPTPCAR